MAISFTPNQVVSWDDLNAVMGQHGSPQGAKSVQRIPWTKEQRRAFEDANLDPDDTNSVSPLYRYFFEDGSYVDAQLESAGDVAGAGRMPGQGSTFRVLDYKPSAKFQADQRKAEANDPANRTPAMEHEAELNRQRAKNAALPPEQDPRYETDQERAARADKRVADQQAAARQQAVDTRAAAADARAEARADQPQTTFREVRQADGSTKVVQVRVYPDGRTEVGPSDVPGNAPTPQSKYVSVQQDKDSGRWFGMTREGRWEPVEGGPGAPTSTAAPGRTPSLPRIITGAAQDALRTGYDEIAAEVDSGRRTPAWGEARRKEIFDAAQLTVREAQLAEQSRQFNQTLGFNVGNTILQHQSGALGDALKFALSINGKLKPGSTAGADLFRAYFMLQQQFLQDSGLRGIVPGGGVSSFPGGLPGAGGAGGTAASAGGAAASAASAPIKVDVNDPRAAADQAHAALAEADRQRVAAEGANAPRPWTDTATGPSVLPPYRPGAPSSAAGGPEPRLGIVGEPGPRSVIDQYASGGPSPQPRPLPLTPESPPAPAATLPGATPAREDWRLLPGAPRVAPPAVLEPIPLAPHPRAMADPPAIRAARVAATPPWRLPPDQLASLVEQYGEDTVFGYPGAPRLAV